MTDRADTIEKIARARVSYQEARASARQSWLQAVSEAHTSGLGVREIARAAGVTHVVILRILRDEKPAETVSVAEVAPEAENRPVEASPATVTKVTRLCPACGWRKVWTHNAAARGYVPSEPGTCGRCAAVCVLVAE